MELMPCHSSSQSITRIAAAGFGGLVDTTRRELAKRYVLGTQTPMTHIAQLLGYSESAAFSRSYQRWHQMPPRRHRQQG
jgi:AraC-like DNA-binding protein